MGANQSRRKENIEKNTLKQTLKKGTFKKIPVFSLTRALFSFTESSLIIMITIIIKHPGAYLREYGIYVLKENKRIKRIMYINEANGQTQPAKIKGIMGGKREGEKKGKKRRRKPNVLKAKRDQAKKRKEKVIK